MKKEDYINKIDANAERRNITNKVELREVNEGEMPTIEGYAAVFEKETDMGWYIEKIARGAFDEADMSNVFALFNHDDDEILSRTTGNDGDLVLSIDQTGLRYSFQAKNECSKEVAENIKYEFITGSSFAFRIKEDLWEYNVQMKDGQVKDVRTIISFETIYDVSPVSYPAYQDTTVALRSKGEKLPKQSGKEAFEEIKFNNK